MSLFKLPVSHKSKEVTTHHPWERTIKYMYANEIKWAHNSVNNPHYPLRKIKLTDNQRIKLSVIGNRVTKEFMYCVNLVRGLHKYRSKTFDVPAIRGVTSVEWPTTWNHLKIKYGGLAYCLENQVAVLYNNNILGGKKELKEFIDSKYIYHLALNYEKETIAQFAGFVKSSGRPCVYLHISKERKHVGTLIFMLYADIAPRTCDNFCRLCTTARGGYAGTPVHRIVKDGWIQCGGFGLKSTDLDCENFIVPHDRRGVLCMANDGRHIDCSTQFFVLLQPAQWMANKYVAFGQLIDGEATLQQIESEPTSYESPKSKIIIYKAGILNLECQRITINPLANKYIEGHIENLVVIGELFIEMLMENVFLEIEFKRIQSLEQTGEEVGDIDRKDIRATQRFMSKKDEMRQLEKTVIESHRPSSGVSQKSKAVSRDENQQFDIDTYEPEEYSYLAGSASSPPREERPFYLALTDVTYPGEVDSIYDLKKFLKGDYCLETDLSPNPSKHAVKAGIEASSIFMYQTGNNMDDVSIQQDLDSDEEREVQIYLAANVDRVSFASSGGIVRSIAKSINLFDNTSKSDQITDEVLRRIRTAPAEVRQQQREPVVSESEKPKPRQMAFSAGTKEHDKGDEVHDDLAQYVENIITKKPKVRLSVVADSEHDHEKHFQRRPTAYMNPGALKFLLSRRAAADDDDNDDDDDDNDNEQHKVHIATEPVDTAIHHDFHRRPTAFARPGTYSFDDDEDDDDAEVEKVTVVDRLDDRLSSQRRDSENKRATRPSVLERLFEEHTTNEPGPTLKNYKPLTKMPPNTLLTHSPEKLMFDDDARDKFITSMQFNDSYDNALSLQRGRNVGRKISTDYLVYVEPGRRTENSIRSVEYARTRPSMTVSEYQQRNLKYQEKLSQSNASFTSRASRISRASKASRTSRGHKTDIEKQTEMSSRLQKGSVSTGRISTPLHSAIYLSPCSHQSTKMHPHRGIRLPGDSPLYQDSTYT